MLYQNSRRFDRAFTLIELLIVVGIIAILAAIAVPNFLESQTRAKVARTKSDLRSIAVALEQYRVDNHSYPIVTLLEPLETRMNELTTPIAYITTLPTDPFFIEDPDASATSVSAFSPLYVYASGNIYAGGAAEFDDPIYWETLYSVTGRGPDNDIVFGGYCMSHPNAIRGKANIRGAYDPTNGTISSGDIFQLSESRL